MDSICYSCIPFSEKKTAIAKTKYFYASLDPRDQRVPRVFIQTHDHVASLMDWTDDHWLEFDRFQKAMEQALRTAFGATMVNTACLMNLAGKEGTHTHWHFIPRLITPLQFEDHLFDDPCYGKPYDMNGKNYRTASDETISKIIKKIQDNLVMNDIILA